MPDAIELICRTVAVEADGATPARTVAGQAVPYNVVATVASGQRVKFLPGSLPLDGANPKLLLFHDKTAPVGVLTERTDDGHGVNIRARVSATQRGDEALALAGDGVLDCFSVGVDPLEYTFEDDVLVVAKGAWREVSMLPFGAFDTARVTQVAASDPPPAISTAPAVQAAPLPAVIAPVPTVATLREPRRDLRWAAGVVAAGFRGELSLGQVRAALAPTPITAAGGSSSSTSSGDVTPQATTPDYPLSNVTTTNVPGVVFPAFIPEIKGLIVMGRPMLAAINQRALPAAGMEVDYPVWGTFPTVGLQAAEKTGVTSTPAAITMGKSPVQTWAGANDVSIQLAQRSNPSFMEAYLAAMAESYARQTDAYVITALNTAATDASGTMPATPTFIQMVEHLFASFADPTAIPAGPFFLAVSWDIAVALIGVTELNGPAFWDMSINLSGMVPDITSGPETDSGLPTGGLTFVVDRLLPAKSMLLGSRMGATWYEDPAAPATIRVVDVSLLGFDVGVYGFGTVAVEYPKAFVKSVGVAPTVAPAVAPK
jgi:HK97 family phage prohead protease